jgi:hypothetical protein
MMRELAVRLKAATKRNINGARGKSSKSSPMSNSDYSQHLYSCLALGNSSPYLNIQ